MAADPSFFLYKETRVSVDSDIPGSKINVYIPAHGTSALRSRQPSRRQHASSYALAQDESAFRRLNLATSSSVYHCRSRPYPRSFLWRVLEDGKVLSIQPIDLGKPIGTNAASATLRLHLPNPLWPAGIAFSDSTENFLTVFALTASNDLYTIDLQPEHFTRSLVSENQVETRCKTFLPSSFTFRHPHRIVARNPQELLISLHDGGFLKLSRKEGADGSAWTETFFNEGGWGSSFRGLIPWQGSNTVRYGNVNLEQTTATALAFSPRTAETESTHVYTVCLNHTLRVWNLETGKLGCTRDLLNQPRQAQELGKFTIDPSLSALLSVIHQPWRAGEDRYVVVTYSPIGPGQFKFWAVDDPDRPDGLRDLHPDSAFEPPTPSDQMWNLTDFRVVPVKDTGSLVIWVLWKNDKVYRIQSLEFDTLNVAEDWTKAWNSVAAETLKTSKEDSLPLATDLESEDPTDKWLAYLFYPGRFTYATLDTTLSIYEQTLNRKADSSARATKSLRDRICSSVGSNVTLIRAVDGAMDWSRYRTDTDWQWRRFYRIVEELDKQRGEAYSLSFDDAMDIAWVVTADQVSAIRRCSDLEILWHNKENLLHSPHPKKALPHRLSKKFRSKQVHSMAVLLEATKEFRLGFSDSLLHQAKVYAQSELFQDTSQVIPERIKSLYDRCDLLNEISEEDFDQLSRSLRPIGGFSGLSTDLFLAIIGLIPQPGAQVQQNHALTEFGEKILVKGCQETISLTNTILSDLLTLFVFLQVDQGLDDDPVPEMDVDTVFLSLTDMLRQYDVLDWFARSTRSEIETLNKEGKPSKSSRASTGEPRMVSLLQSPWVSQWRPYWASPSLSLSTLITEAFDLVFATIGLSDSDTYKKRVQWFQRHLIARGQYDLASQFTKYLPNDAWSTYLSGRLHLCKKEHAEAASDFDKAAFALAHREGVKIGLVAGDDLLSEEDGQWFNHGLHPYYNHIAYLYDSEDAWSHMADFLSKSLQFLPSPASQETRTQILSRLFKAYISTQRFHEAYATLLRYTDNAKQRTDLEVLVKTICISREGAMLSTLPFLGLQDAVDDILASKCNTILNISAGPPYHKILYAWRIKRGDFRGAATVLYERLLRLKQQSTSSSALVKRKLDLQPQGQNTAVTEAYLALINTLASVEPGQAWILATPPATTTANNKGDGHGKQLFQPGVGKDKAPKRAVITIDDIRRGYQEELDRIAIIENNQFAFGEGYDDGDAMDVL